MWLSNFKIVSDKCHIYDKLDGNISGTNHLKLKKLQGAQFWNKYFAEKIVQCPECVSSKCPIANVESYFHKGCQYFLRALEILGILRHFFPDSNKFFWPVLFLGGIVSGYTFEIAAWAGYCAALLHDPCYIMLLGNTQPWHLLLRCSTSCFRWIPHNLPLFLLP